MRTTILLFSFVFISALSFSQGYMHSGKDNMSVALFDSGGVRLDVSEFNFDNCNATHEIYKCEFTFKNNNSFSVILKGYSFYSYNDDSAGRVPCAVSKVSTRRSLDTLASNSMKTVTIYGETKGIYHNSTAALKTGCTYHWEFSGFAPLKK